MADKGPDDIICHCNQITKGAIVEAIARCGCKTAEEVGEQTTAGTVCGGCLGDIGEILEDYYKNHPK
eukprot:m51a1_g13385 putative nitrite reductase (67) ;mRNA; r:2984-3184